MADVRSCLLVCLAVLACRPADRQPSAEVLVEARRQLEERGREDQRIREGFGVGGQVDSAQIRAMMRADSASTEWLKSWVSRWGWPTSEQVGSEAVQAAFLIVQHAVHDTGFMRAMLPAIEESHRRGDLDGGSVAMLTDRLEVKAGRPQRYGTQLSLRDGKWVLDPIADSAQVDERRRRMGLPPLAGYLRLVDSVFRTSQPD
jgi:hypothetical protein